MTYRTGIDGVTIVREVPGAAYGEPGGDPDAQLVAVVTNGDQVLAERICALLNADAAGVFACDQCEDARYHRHIPPRAYSEPSVEDWDWPPADSCTCAEPSGLSGCPVHQGRKARGPKPPPLGPGCICDGSGRHCPRHGAVI